MKEDIIKQINAEARSSISDKQAELDAMYYHELAGPNASRAVRKLYAPPDLQTELMIRLKQLSGLRTTVHDFSLDVFKDNATRTEYKKTYGILKKYCDSFPPSKNANLILCGKAGTGKTHAAQIVGTKLLGRGFSVIYTTAFALIERFKNYVFNFQGTALDHLLTCDLLIIDDLGTEPKIKNISDEYLLNVVNERMANNKAFIITTNLSPDDILARYDERLTSRVLSQQTSVVIEMKSKDLRLN